MKKTRPQKIWVWVLMFCLTCIYVGGNKGAPNNKTIGLIHGLRDGIVHGCVVVVRSDPQPIRLRVYAFAEDEQEKIIGLTATYLNATYSDDSKCDCWLRGNRFAFRVPKEIKNGKQYFLRFKVINTDGSETLVNKRPFACLLSSDNEFQNNEYFDAFREERDGPTQDVITSLDGSVSVGVSRRFGGAINTVIDKRFPELGNMIDRSNGGTLFSAAIWTLPPNLKEQALCHLWQTTDNILPGTIPFNNPTQGGYLGNGWAGNPNFTSVIVQDNKIHVRTRLVNYNFGYCPWYSRIDGKSSFPDDSNKNEWQTDFETCLDIYFHPHVENLIVVDTTITYLPNDNKSLVFQDVQHATLFGAGKSHPDPYFRGHFGRFAYMNKNLGLLVGTWDEMLRWNNNNNVLNENKENWMAILHEEKDMGIGVSVLNYESIDITRFGHYSIGEWPSITAHQSQIDKFYGVGIVPRTSVKIDDTEYDDILRFEIEPFGKFQTRTFMATGGIDRIRYMLMAAAFYKLPQHLY